MGFVPFQSFLESFLSLLIEVFLDLYQPFLDLDEELVRVVDIVFRFLRLVVGREYVLVNFFQGSGNVLFSFPDIEDFLKIYFEKTE